MSKVLLLDFISFAFDLLYVMRLNKESSIQVRMIRILDRASRHDDT